MLLALLLLGVLQSTPAFELAAPEVAAERVARCGLGRPRIRFDKALQMQKLVLRRSSQATDNQLACIDIAAGYYEVELPLVLNWRLRAIRIARIKAELKELARTWLAAQGLLDRLPPYRPGEEAVFVREVERMCGPEAGGALHPADGGYGLDPEWLARQAPDSDAYQCVSHALMASGFPLGFVGNETEPPGR